MNICMRVVAEGVHEIKNLIADRKNNVYMPFCCCNLCFAKL